MRNQAILVLSLILAFAVRTVPLEHVSGGLPGMFHSEAETSAGDMSGEGWEESPEFRQPDGNGFTRGKMASAMGPKSCQTRKGSILGDRMADDIPTPPPDRLG